ncbi:MAG TPA: GntR family transcriptional regulator [Spirochaetales bacterium]|nr:GntR family transcriptional regulator [Spirochaetales bacterium]
MKSSTTNILPEHFEIDRQSITDRVYEHIKKLILAGYFKGGEKIPEERVAQQLKVSRTPIREALRRLEKYGLIYIKPRSYAVVVELKDEEIKQIGIVRLVLEKLAFQLLCDVISEEDIVFLEEIVDKCSELHYKGCQAESFEMDSFFHLEIARRSGNKHLYEILERLDAKVQLLRLRHNFPLQKFSQYIDQHKKFILLLKEKKMDEIIPILENHIMHD